MMTFAPSKHHLQNNSEIFLTNSLPWYDLSTTMLSGYPASRTDTQCCSWPRGGTQSTTTTGTQGPGPSRMASGLQRWEASWVSWNMKKNLFSVITWSIVGLSAMAEALLRDPNQLSLVRESGQVCRNFPQIPSKWKFERGLKKIIHRSSLPGRTIRMTWLLFNTWSGWVWTESYMTGDLK